MINVFIDKKLNFISFHEKCFVMEFIQYAEYIFRSLTNIFEILTHSLSLLRRLVAIAFHGIREEKMTQKKTPLKMQR